MLTALYTFPPRKLCLQYKHMHVILHHNNVYAMMREHFFKLHALLNTGLFLSRCPKSLQVMLVIFYDHCWEFWRNFQISTRENGVVTLLKQSVRGISGFPYWYLSMHANYQLGPSQIRIDIQVISFSLMKLFVHADILKSLLRS